MVLVEFGTTQFDQDLAPYVVKYPYISNQTGQDPDGNPVLYFALAMGIKHQFYPLSLNDREQLQATYADIKVQPGLISRSRFKRADHEAHDDYIGLAHASYFLDQSIAKEIVAYGRAHNWCFENLNGATPRSWHWRLPGVIQHYKLAAGERLGILDAALWSITMFFPADNESGLQLEWLMLDLYLSQNYRCWIMDAAAKHWFKKLSENTKYPDRMGSVLAKYFGAGHVFAKWMTGVIRGSNAPLR